MSVLKQILLNKELRSLAAWLNFAAETSSTLSQAKGTYGFQGFNRGKRFSPSQPAYPFLRARLAASLVDGVHLLCRLTKPFLGLRAAVHPSHSLEGTKQDGFRARSANLRPLKGLGQALSIRSQSQALGRNTNRSTGARFAVVSPAATVAIFGDP